jgi:hypothetical protein
LRLCERKKQKKNMAPRNSAGQAAKPPSQSAAAESQTEWTTISLRLCVIARIKKKINKSSAAADRLQSRKVAKNWELSLCGSASLREKEKSIWLAKSPSQSAAAEGKI